jgi:hypothetical protein
MNRPGTRLLALTAALALAACGGDDSTGLDGDLSEAEAAALGTVIMGQALTAGFSAMGGASGVAGPALSIPFGSSIEVTESCPLGGSVAISGDFSGDLDLGGGSSTIDMDVSMTHQSCRLSDPSTGLLFTLNGAPTLTTDMSMVLNSDGSGTFSGGYGGAVAWDLDGRSGECTLDIDFSGSVTASGEDNTSITGTVCGQPIT